MISPLNKTSLGVGLAGVIGLGGYGLYSLTSKSPAKTIRQSLQENSGIVILDVNGTTDDEDWKEKISKLDELSRSKKLKDYKKSNASTNELRNKEDLEKIKSICKGLFESDLSDELKLEEAKEWCTKGGAK